MCGIVGIVSAEPSVSRVIEGLRRVEYRGYDSAGVASIEDGHLTRVRAEGKLINLEEKLKSHFLSGKAVIGHTRWATHGEVSEANAHPHMTDRIGLVHNGIIENFAEFREELERDGVVFESNTDTEVVAHLISAAIAATKPESWERHPERVIYRVLSKLRGAYALLILFDGRDDLIIAARHGMPVAIGYGKGEMFVGSDAIALSPFTKKIGHLRDGDIAVITKEGARIFNAGRDNIWPVPTSINVETVDTSDFMVDRGGFPHFMAKEIFEQPDVVGKTLGKYLDFAAGKITLPRKLQGISWASMQRLTIVACGTSNYAAHVAKYFFEEYANLDVDVDIASEFRYRKKNLSDRDLTIVVSQSGETADTLKSLEIAMASGVEVLAVVNVQSSSIARAATYVLPTLAGTEVGVASTKAFTCQVAALAVLALAAGEARGVLSEERRVELVSALSRAPGMMSELFKLEEQFIEIADKIAPAKHALYLGRGVSYPLALEGALKLKEISYIHAEGYAAGEMKHGPIALIDSDMPVIVIAPTYDKELFEKTVSNMHEVAARKGKIVFITDKGGAAAVKNVETLGTVVLPEADAFGASFGYAMALQLLAYHTAVRLGRNVDQPRNLAKSVTVE